MKILIYKIVNKLKHIKAIFKMIYFKVRELIIILTVQFIKEIGMKDKDMAKENIYLQMEIFYKENLQIIIIYICDFILIYIQIYNNKI